MNSDKLCVYMCNCVWLCVCVSVYVQACKLFVENAVFGSRDDVQYLLLISAVMRTMSLLQENILPMIPQLLQGLTQKLILVSKVQRASF